MRFNCGNGSLWNGDCLELMRLIPSGSVDMILCDLPYGTTQNKWDAVIPFAPLWSQYWRVCKPNAAIVLTASQPFTTALIISQIDFFRYEWIWNKINRITGAPLANKMPMKAHENICVFYKSLPAYNKQFRMKPRLVGGRKSSLGGHGAEIERTNNEYQKPTTEDVPHNPISIIDIEAIEERKGKRHSNIHPTQKPVALFEYLIKTYTNPGETVLDNCSGSGTTAIAAERTGRRWICIEKDLGYYFASAGRIHGEVNAT